MGTIRATLSPKIALSWGYGPHLTHDPLGPPEPITQTASRSVLPFLHGWLRSVPIIYNGTLLPLSKLPLLMGDLADWHQCNRPNLRYMVPWAHPSPQPKRQLDRWSSLCRPGSLMWQTLRQTDRPRYSVFNNHGVDLSLHLLRPTWYGRCGIIIIQKISEHSSRVLFWE